MFLLVAQLDYDGPMKETLQRMAAKFLLLFYGVAWLRAPVAEDAPASALNLYHIGTGAVQAVSLSVANAAFVVIRRHLGTSSHHE